MMTQMTNVNETYFPSNVMKNILEFCGEPLPKNKKGSCGFGWQKTKVYYRENGVVKCREEQLKVICKCCQKGFWDTGYEVCKMCYEKPCETCGGSKHNPFKKSCMNCLEKTMKFKCRDCKKPMEKNFPFCWDCKDGYRATNYWKIKNTKKNICKNCAKTDNYEECVGNYCYDCSKYCESESEEEEKEEIKRMCITCNSFDLSKEPEWKKECIKCYYKKKNGFKFK